MFTRLSIVALIVSVIFILFQASKQSDPCAWSNRQAPSYACAFAGGMK